MYFSRVTLKLNRLPYVMQQKMQNSGLYAIHQWLWQLFPNQEKRCFLFREERIGKGYQYYLLSEIAPLTNHELFLVETKPYQPKLTVGMKLIFSLRANPVVFKNGKRSDVMMNAKYLAKQQGLDNEIKIRQNEAAINWLIKQSESRGFSLSTTDGQQLDCTVINYTLYQGVGKSKGFGCGLFLLKHYQ